MSSTTADTFQVRDKVATYLSYEDYLDSLTNDVDRMYLGDEDVARLDARRLVDPAGDTLCGTSAPMGNN